MFVSFLGTEIDEVVEEPASFGAWPPLFRSKINKELKAKDKKEQ